MDLSILLWLQGIRESLPGFVEQFFVVVSAIAASKYLIILPCLLFWCLDKRAGRFVLFSYSIGAMCNQFIKNTVCAYRPWIRSSDIHPSEGALDEATGYSFPSGHTQTAVDVFGATGVQYRKRWPWLNVVCWVYVALVAFSRLFLGVHAPQDVLVALIEGILVLWVAQRLLEWVDAADGRDLRVLVIGLLVFVAFIVYVTVKPYPMDYDSAGALVVDPVEMQVDCYKVAGVFAGALLGWFLEKRFIAFEADPKKLGLKGVVLRFVVGLVVVLGLHVAAGLLSHVISNNLVVQLIKYFVTIFAAAYVAPLVFTTIEKRMA